MNGSNVSLQWSLLPILMMRSSVQPEPSPPGCAKDGMSIMLFVRTLPDVALMMLPLSDRQQNTRSLRPGRASNEQRQLFLALKMSFSSTIPMVYFNPHFNYVP